MYSGKNIHKNYSQSELWTSRIESWRYASLGMALGRSVMTLIEYNHNLQAGDALYHKICCTNFKTWFQFLQNVLAEDAQPSCNPKEERSQDFQRMDAFIKVADYIVSHDNEQTTLNILIEKIRLLPTWCGVVWIHTHEVQHPVTLWWWSHHHWNQWQRQMLQHVKGLKYQ